MPPSAPADVASATLHTARWRDALTNASAGIAEVDSKRACGRLTRAAGLVLEAMGLRMPVGSDCLIELPGRSHDHGGPRTAEAEVVGFGADTPLPDAAIGRGRPGAGCPRRVRSNRRRSRPASHSPREARLEAPAGGQRPAGPRARRRRPPARRPGPDRPPPPRCRWPARRSTR